MHIGGVFFLIHRSIDVDSIQFDSIVGIGKSFVNVVDVVERRGGEREWGGAEKERRKERESFI